MDWIFKNEHDAHPDQRLWAERVLAPLASVAASNGWHEGEERLVLNLACARELFPAATWGSWHAEAEAALATLRDSPCLRGRAERRLAELLAELPPERAALLADRLVDAMQAVAMASPVPGSAEVSIDDAERSELGRLYRLLIGARRASGSRRAAEGGAAFPFADSMVAPAGHGTAAASPPRTAAAVSPSATASPAPWLHAAGWDESLADRAFDDLAAMHAAHEGERARGAGRLDGAAQFVDVRSDAEPWCDSGIAASPSDWAERTVWIVGDLHGDFDSLARALAAAGVETDSSGCDRLPERAAVVFLGDLGDRGSGTLAVWLRVAALKARHPGQVQILRGNHEEVQPVRLARPDGTPMRSDWVVPTTTNMEAYLSLTLALRSSLENLAMVYEHLPDLLVLPRGWVAVHGALPPRWKENDGWPADATAEARAAVSIECLCDLRKEVVRSALRWTDAVDRPVIDFGWAGHARGSRLFSGSADHEHWRSLLGEHRIVHGHTHPAEGGRFEWEGRALALNTSRHTAPRQQIAYLRNGEMTLRDLTP